MSEGWNIAVLGASGTTGRALIELLEQRQFPVGKLYLLAKDNGVGENIRFNHQSIKIQDATTFDWSLADMAFFVAGQHASDIYAETAAATGCLVIDSSGLFALEPDIPLVVPSVNPTVLNDYRNRNIVAIADSLTCQLLTSIKPVIESMGLAQLNVHCYLPAAYYGKLAVDDLAGQSARLLNGLPTEQSFFNKQLAFNLLPLISTDDVVAEEARIVDQTRKVLQDYSALISVSCLQVPVFYGVAQTVQLLGLSPIYAEQARDIYQTQQHIVLTDQTDYPTQVTDASGNDQLTLGCLRNDYGVPEQLNFWTVADNIHFGSALMAIESAEKLIKEYMY